MNYPKLPGPPTEPGWYWLRDPELARGEWVVAQVEDDSPGKLSAFGTEWGGGFEVDEMPNAEWRGPIQPPTP